MIEYNGKKCDKSNRIENGYELTAKKRETRALRELTRIYFQIRFNRCTCKRRTLMCYYLSSHYHLHLINPISSLHSIRPQISQQNRSHRSPSRIYSHRKR